MAFKSLTLKFSFNKKYFIILLCISLIVYSIEVQASSKKIINISDIEQYLNSFSTLQAKFKQVGPAIGDIKTGKLFLSKPGNIKWEYLEPKKITIIGNKNLIIYHDHELEETSNLSANTMRGYLLTKEKLVLNKDVNILSFKQENDSAELVFTTLEKQEEEQETKISLYFSTYPKISLDKLFIIDSDSLVTEIDLVDLEYNKPISKNTYIFKDPKFFELEY